MIKMRQLLASFLTILLFIIGCARMPQKARQATREREFYEDSETLIVLDNAARKYLYAVNQSASWTEDGRLTAKAKLLNKSNSNLKIQIQTVFKDNEGYALDETNWELIIIPGNAYYHYLAKSLNNKAEKYTIRCRLAK